MGVLLANVDQNFDISGPNPVELLSYTNNSTKPVLFIAKIEVEGVVGTGSYYPEGFINNHPDSPIFPLQLIGQTSFIVQMDMSVLTPGDTLSLRLRGVAGDTNVHCRAYVTDAGADTNLSDTDIAKITDAVVASLSNLTVNPTRTVLAPIQTCAGERVILAPIPQTVKTFILPK